MAIHRAETELELRVTAVNGWCLDYDVTDPRWQWLERMKCHVVDLHEASLNTGAATPDQTENTLAELRTILGPRMLVLSLGDQITPEISLPPLVVIDDRSAHGSGFFDSSGLDRVLGAAKIFLRNDPDLRIGQV